MIASFKSIATHRDENEQNRSKLNTKLFTHRYKRPYDVILTISLEFSLRVAKPLVFIASVRAQTALRGVVAPCYPQYHHQYIQVPQLLATQSDPLD